MARKWRAIRSLTDEALIAAHNREAATTVVGIQHYIDELRYRSQTRIVEEQSRIAARVEKFTLCILWLTVIVTIATLANIAMAILGVMGIT